MESEDIFILQKIIAIGDNNWSAELLALELDHSQRRIEEALENLRHSEFLNPKNEFQNQKVLKYLLKDLHREFPTRPGRLGKGILTGAKPGSYFCIGLPYSSIWIWPESQGTDIGYEIEPLSTKCCFAVLQDEKLKQILAITETLRVSGPEAVDWAEASFRQIGLF